MSIDLLRKLGVYIDTTFLSADMCAELCAEMDQASKRETPVYQENLKSDRLDLNIRQSFYADISNTMAKPVADKILALRPTLEAHFGERLHDQKYETPKFALYETGHYFRPHVDSQLHRKINMSIYLNNEATDECKIGYSGGQLVLYGLFSNPAFVNKGIALQGQCGMLVAYRAETIHEITPVTDGQRYAVIARFLDSEI